MASRPSLGNAIRGMKAAFHGITSHDLPRVRRRIGQIGHETERTRSGIEEVKATIFRLRMSAAHARVNLARLRRDLKHNVARIKGGQADDSQWIAG